jgi:S-DNA-T family DNA segregation ATPase FtsK/SpoIIIE
MAARTASGSDHGGVSEFLARRATEALGLCLLAVALLVAVALWGYDPNDPSLNHATAGPSSNPLGHLGASIADVTQQTLGLATWLLVAILPLWAVRLIFGRPLAWPWVPVAALPLALLAGAAWLATRPLPDSWPFWVGLGGFVGDYMLHRLERPVGPEIYPTITGCLALVFAILSAGLSLRELWQGAGALVAAPRVGGGGDRRIDRALDVAGARVEALAARQQTAEQRADAAEDRAERTPGTRRHRRRLGVALVDRLRPARLAGPAVGRLPAQ